MTFPQAPAGPRRILGGWRRSGWLWCCGRSCWWCSQCMTKRSSSAGSGRGRRGPSERRYKVVALLLKPSLGLFGFVCRRRVLLPHPGSATGHLIAPGDNHTLHHIQVHFGVDFQADFEDVRWDDVALSWNHTKDHNRCRKLCFHQPGHVPVIRGNPDLHFEGAGNGPVFITCIGRGHELYSGASLISLVEHCVIFRHDRRLLSLLRFVYNWPTYRWSATKKENRFSLNGNGIMSSFLGRQFYRSTLVTLRQLSLRTTFIDIFSVNCMINAIFSRFSNKNQISFKDSSSDKILIVYNSTVAFWGFKNVREDKEKRNS